MKPIHIGMIGYGGIGRVHAMAYRDIGFHYGLPAQTVQIAGVATSRAETAHKAAAEIGCDFYTADYRELLARPEITAVDICTPNDSHEEIVIAAAQAGKHIYCEKPLAISVAEGRRIVEAVEASGVHTQMTFNFRFFPALIRARQLIDSGFLGRIFHFRGRYYRSGYISASKPYTWRLSKAVSGGGALYDIGSHVLDIVYYLLGDFDSVQAHVETLIPQRPVAAGSSEMMPVDVDDMALLHLKMTSGVAGSVEVSRMGTGATNDLQIEISGDQGAIRFKADDPTWLEVYDVRDSDSPLGGMRGFRKVETALRYDGAKSPDWTMTPSFLRTHAECQYQFIKALDENRSPTPTLRDGLRIQEVMEAAQRASSEGRWVKISELR
jgi:predicted dehydrogenase